MGSGSSKTRRVEGGSASSVSSTCSFSSAFSYSTGSRIKKRGIFRSTCLGSSSRAYDSDDDDDQVLHLKKFNHTSFWYLVFDFLVLGFQINDPFYRFMLEFVKTRIWELIL